MNEVRDLAKTKPSLQNLQEHTDKVLACLTNILSFYGDHFNERQKALFKYACKYHDYGKLNDLFQDKVMAIPLKDVEIHHGYLSPYALPLTELQSLFTEEELKILITAIFYHHTRNHQPPPSGVYRQYGEKYLFDNLRKYMGIEPEIFKITKYCLFDANQLNFSLLNDSVWREYCLVAGILKKCDQAASADVKNVEMPLTYHGKYLSDYVREKYNTLYDFQKEMFENKDRNVLLVAPTGSGKTEAALLWLDQDKGFYTLPYKIASSAIYRRIIEEYQYPSVTLLHSDCVFVFEEEKERLSLEEQEKENIFQKVEESYRLSYPVTVCTVDQLLKFPYKAFGTEPFYATLCYSKVIIDEIQMYSPNILACLIIGLQQIVQNGGKFMIMTATFPPILEDFLKEYIGEENYHSYRCDVLDYEKRHKIELKQENMDYDAILECGRQKKVLVICNSVKKAREVYSILNAKNPSVVQGLLHARYIKKDRRNLEKQIQEFAKSNGTGIWVTTQLVEASLDIDFDELFTFMAPADSLVQRFGRCYRKRKYEGKLPNIHIYYIPALLEEEKRIYEPELCRISYDRLLAYHNRFMSEQDKLDYINSVYCLKSVENTQYYQDIKKYLRIISRVFPAEYNKKEADKKFRAISNVEVIPDEFFVEEVLPLLEQFNQEKKSEEKLKLKMKILEYTVSIPYYQVGGNEKSIHKKLNIYRYQGKYDELGLSYDKKGDNFVD